MVTKKKKTKKVTSKTVTTKQPKQTPDPQSWWSDNAITDLVIPSGTLQQLDKYKTRITRYQYIGKKVDYLIAREILTAKYNLPDVEFQMLLDDRKISKTTKNRYLRLGKSIFLDKLYKLNRLPMKWSILMFLVKQPSSVQDQLPLKMYPDIEMSQCVSLVKEIENHNISKSERIQSETVSVIGIKYLREKLKTVNQVKLFEREMKKLQKLDFLSFDDSKLVDKIATMKTKVKLKPVVKKDKKKIKKTAEKIIDKGYEEYDDSESDSYYDTNGTPKDDVTLTPNFKKGLTSGSNPVA